MAVLGTFASTLHGATGAVQPGARFAARAYRNARKAALDPRTIGVLSAGPRVVAFLNRASSRSARADDVNHIVPVRPTAGLAFQAYLDELLIALFRHPRLLPSNSDYGLAADELAQTYEHFQARGWLDNPASYHVAPHSPDRITLWHDRRAAMAYEHITFESEWEAHEGEVGRDRWLDHRANRLVHGWISQAPLNVSSDTWLVCVHGFGMGSNPMMDLRAFRAPQLNALGLNVAIPVMPLHGARASGSVRGEDFMTIDMVDSMHGVAQAVWDVRRLINWLREERGATKIGVIGYSLGGLVASLVASLESDLECVIAGIPVADLPDLFRRHSPPHVARLAHEYGVLGEKADAVHSVVSPLALECQVPFERRFIFAGLGDRMSTFGHAHRLWTHWEMPRLATYAGGHVGFYWSAAVRQFVVEALQSSGLLNVQAQTRSAGGSQPNAAA